MPEITVDVGVRLQAMQSSVAELQRVLDKLQPNSSGFKDLQKIISNITSNMDRLRLQTNKPFGSQGQFNQTEKTVAKLEESLDRAKLAVERIKFSDLKLDNSQIAQLDGFNNQLKKIKEEFAIFKDDLKNQFLSDDFNKKFIEGINPNLLNKSFDEIVKNVQSKTDALGRTLANATSELTEFKKAAALGEKIDKASQNGVISEQGLGKDVYDKFFQTNKAGVFSFKTGGGLKKGEIQQQFLEYLRGEFQLTPAQIDELTGLSAKDIRAKLAQADFFDPQKVAAEKANKKLPQAGLDFTAASQNYENAVAVMTRLAPLLDALSNKDLDLAEKQKLVNQAIADFQQKCEGGVRGAVATQNAFGGLNSQLESFKQQLSQANSQWLRLQKQQATFNSMKMAITNFMGFNQVLNLTKRAVKDAMNHIKQLDATMNGISIVTDMSTADLWKQVDAYSALAQKFGTTIQGAYDISKIYYQQGLETSDVMTLTEETLKLSKVSGLDYAKSTDYMTTALRGFKMEMKEASTVVDVYSNLAANTAVSQEELAVAMSKTASSMESVGSTFQETSAMIATMVAVTRESATNIGSAMKSIASRYGELTKDPQKLLDSEGEAMSFNKVDAALQSVGITMQTADHQFRDFTDVIVELSEKWDTLDSTQQRYIATQFAGNRQQSRFLALVSNGDLLRENMETAANSEDVGTIQALKAMDSIESKMNQVQVAAQQFYTTLGAEGVWKGALDGIRSYVDTLNSLPKAFGKIPIGAIAAISNIVGLIKSFLMSALSDVAGIWNQMTAQAVSTLGNGGQQAGHSWVMQFINEIKGGVSNAQQAGQEVANAAKAGATQTNTKPSGNNYQSGQIDTIINKGLGLGGVNLAGTMNSDELRQEFADRLNEIQNITGLFTDEQQAKFDALKANISDVSSFQTAMEKVRQELVHTDQQTEQSTSKWENFRNALTNKNSAAYQGVLNLSRAFVTLGMMIDKTTESGRRLAGTFTGMGGLLQTGLGIAGAIGGGPLAWAKAAPMILGGVTQIINGIDLAYENAEERAERLSKTAEELGNKAKEEKANYNILDRSVNKLRELENARYDSAEAAEEYQTAVDELADKYPQLITGLDEAGNATIEATNLDYELEKARKAAAEATLAAAEAERQAAQDKLTTAIETKESNIEEQDFSALGSPIEDHEGLFTPFIQKADSLEGVLQKAFMKAGQSDVRTAGQTWEDTLLAKLASDKRQGIKTSADNKSYSVNLEELESSLPAEENEYKEWDKIVKEYIDFQKGTEKQSIVLDQDIQKYGEQIRKLEELKGTDAFDNAVRSIFNDISSAPLDMQEKISKAFESFMAWGEEYRKNQDNIDKYDEVLESTKKVELSAKINDYKNERQETFKNIDEANAIFAAYLVQQTQELSNEEYKEYINSDQIKTDFEAVANAYEQLSPVDAIKFVDMFKNRNQYTIKDFEEEFGTAAPKLVDAVKAYYEQNFGLSGNVENLYKQLDSNFKDTDIDYENIYGEITYAQDIISRDLANWISSAINLAKDYASDGFSTAANNILNDISDIIEPLEELSLSSRINVGEILKQYDLKTVSGVESILKEIENIQGTEKLQQALRGLKEHLIYNIPLAIQSYTQEIVSNAEDVEKSIKDISKGLSLSDAVKALEKINADGGVQVSLQDLKQKNGKFYLESMVDGLENVRERYIKAVLAENDAELQAIQNRINGLNSNENNIDNQLGQLFEFYNNTKPDELAEKIFNINQFQEGFAVLQSMGLTTQINDNQFQLNATKFAEVFSESNVTIEALQAALNAQLETGIEVATFLHMYLPGQEALGAGNYQEYLKRIKAANEGVTTEKYDEWGQNWFDVDLFKVMRGESIEGFTYDQLKPMKEQISNAYKTLISDVLEKGFDNIHLEDYEGLIDNVSIDLGGSYKDFVSRIIELGKYTIEEQNALMVQAIEKDTQKTKGASDALKNITMLSKNKGLGDLSDIQSLADALGIEINTILGEYNEQLGQYAVDLSKIDLSQIDNGLQILADSIQNFLSSIADDIGKGLEGKLDYAGRDNLIASLKQFNIDLELDDFTRTVDGLELSQQKAIEVYNTLKQIDNVSSKITLESLAKSLEETNENYTSISTISKRIADLQREIGKLPVNDARRQEYEAELKVAQEIYRVRSSTDNKDFDFMSRSLPNGMANPISYWDATGEAFKAMNKASKSGYMEIQDFYNIVNEMNNMAATSGQTLTFMGQKLSGSAEDAARLIEAGMGALKNIDGEGVKVSLKNIGAGFKVGASDMTGDFDDGIKVMAKSQIKMLDAAINMLEAIVAMENIDTNKDGIFDMGEIFKDGGPEFDDDVNTWLDYVENACGGIEIGGVSLRKALEDLASESEEGKIKVVEFLSSLRTLDFESGNIADVSYQIQNLVNRFWAGKTVSVGESIYDLLKVPKDAKTDSDEFKQWAKDKKIQVKDAEEIIKQLQNVEEGLNIDKSAGKKEKSLYASVEKLLGLKGKEKGYFEKFAGDKITNQTVKYWENIGFDYDKNGKIIGAVYHGSDGGSITLDKDNPEGWSKQIEDYEAAITKAKKLGGTTVKAEDSNNTAFTFETTYGSKQIINIVANDGSTWYNFGDYLTSAGSIEEAIGKYLEYLKSTHPKQYKGKDDDEILIEKGYLLEQTTKIDFKDPAEANKTINGKTDDQLQKAIEDATPEFKNGKYHWNLDFGNGENIEIDTNGKQLDVETLKRKTREAVGIDENTVANIAQGITDALDNAGLAEKIAEALGTAIHDAFTGDVTSGKEENVDADVSTLNVSVPAEVNASVSPSGASVSGAGIACLNYPDLDSAWRSWMYYYKQQLNLGENEEVSIPDGLTVTAATNGVTNYTVTVSDGQINYTYGKGDAPSVDLQSKINTHFASLGIDTKKYTITTPPVLSADGSTSVQYTIKVTDQGNGNYTVDLPGLGELSTADVNATVQSWLNEQTNEITNTIKSPEPEQLNTITKKVEIPGAEFNIEVSDLGNGWFNVKVPTLSSPILTQNPNACIQDFLNTQMLGATLAITKESESDPLPALNRSVEINGVLYGIKIADNGEGKYTIEFPDGQMNYNVTDIQDSINRWTKAQGILVTRSLYNTNSEEGQELQPPIVETVTINGVTYGIVITRDGEGKYNVTTPDGVTIPNVMDVGAWLNTWKKTKINDIISAVPTQLDPVTNANGVPNPQIPINVNGIDYTITVGAGGAYTIAGIDGTFTTIDQVVDKIVEQSNSEGEVKNLPQKANIDIEVQKVNIDIELEPIESLTQVVNELILKPKNVKIEQNPPEDTGSDGQPSTFTPGELPKFPSQEKFINDGFWGDTGTLGTIQQAYEKVQSEYGKGENISALQESWDNLCASISQAGGATEEVKSTLSELEFPPELLALLNLDPANLFPNTSTTSTPTPAMQNDSEIKTDKVEAEGAEITASNASTVTIETDNPTLSSDSVNLTATNVTIGTATPTDNSGDKDNKSDGKEKNSNNNTNTAPAEQKVNVSLDVSQFTNAVSQAQSALDGITATQITSTKDTIINALNTISTKFSGAASNINSIAKNIKTIPDINKQVTLKYTTQKSSAKGTFGGNAFATGTRTLMGELGPEMVVTNGHYYVVGENGAEFVNLAKDSIVFNHKQTKKLLNNGAIGSRGKPTTTVSNAISFAKGGKFGPARFGDEPNPNNPPTPPTEKISEEIIASVTVDPTSHKFKLSDSKAKGDATGPALASASAALSALKQIRAMWQRMLDASAKDLGSQAGRGGKGGGGGGGGGGKDDKDQPKTTTADIQRWYNWLRQIEHIEMHITEQEKYQSQYESDRVANGELIYKTQKDRLKLLDQEIVRNQKLADLQKSWYDNKRKELAESSYGKIFTYDEYGLQQYVGEDQPGSGVGLDILENLTRRDVKGQAKDNAATAKAQLKYLQSVGFNISDLLYNDDGTKVAKSINSNLKLSKFNKKDKDNDLYVQMMENFWDRVDGWRDELDSLYDSYHEQLEKVIENQTKQNELIQAMVDNELSIEQDLVKAIEDREQAEIDRLQDERDALDEASSKFLDGLNDSLSKEREMYEKNQAGNELTKLQRQLAILQRSGGSASQIKSLQDQIASKQKDAYFDAQQSQIDAIQEASDKQIEKLDTQIDLMTKNLEYQKENGLLWIEVRQIMNDTNTTASDVAAMILAWSKEYRENSALQNGEDLTDFTERFQEWTEFREDKNADEDLWTQIEKEQNSNKEYADYLNKSNKYLGDTDTAAHKERAKAASLAAYHEAYDAAIKAGKSEKEADDAGKEAAIKAGNDTMGALVNSSLKTSDKYNEDYAAASTVFDNIVLNEKKEHPDSTIVNDKTFIEHQDEIKEAFIDEYLNDENKFDEEGNLIGENVLTHFKTAASNVSEDYKVNEKQESHGPFTAYTFKDNQKLKNGKKYTQLIAAEKFDANTPFELTGRTTTKVLSTNNKKSGKLQKGVKFVEILLSDGKTPAWVRSDELYDAYQEQANVQKVADEIKSLDSINTNNLEPKDFTLRSMTPFNYAYENEKGETIRSKLTKDMHLGISHIKFKMKDGKAYDVDSVDVSTIAGNNVDLTFTGSQLGTANVNALLSEFGTRAYKKKKKVNVKVGGKKYAAYNLIPNLNAYYKTGGIADFTGPAWLDGTPSAPEAVLNAAQTKFLREDMLGNSSTSLISIVAALQDAIANTSSGSSSYTEGINIENISINFQPGVISNDYSAKRAGDMAIQEIIKVARKAGNNSVSRR